MIGYLNFYEIFQMISLILSILLAFGIIGWFCLTKQYKNIKKWKWLPLIIICSVFNISTFILLVLWLSTYIGGWEGITYLKFISSIMAIFVGIILILITIIPKRGKNNNEKTS